MIINFLSSFINLADILKEEEGDDNAFEIDPFENRSSNANLLSGDQGSEMKHDQKDTKIETENQSNPPEQIEDDWSDFEKERANK